jgi:hypothetical protein
VDADAAPTSVSLSPLWYDPLLRGVHGAVAMEGVVTPPATVAVGCGERSSTGPCLDSKIHP